MTNHSFFSKKLFLLAFGCFVLFLSFATWNQVRENSILENSFSESRLSYQDREIIKIKLADQILEVEVVNSPESITQGLSGRTEIGHDGMLFVFSGVGERQFWMKEMLFDLDLVWINDGVVVGVSENVPHPDPKTPLNQLPTYKSPGLVDMVLEIPAGQSKLIGIEAGVKLEMDPVVAR